MEKFHLISLLFLILSFILIVLYIIIGIRYKNKEIIVNKLLEDYNNWASKQFPNSTSLSSLIGLEREIIEVKEKLFEQEVGLINDEALKFEYVDCLMYLIDSARRSGISIEQLFIHFEKKLEINKNRDWKINSDNSYSHVK